MLTSPRSRKGSAEGEAAPGAAEPGVEVTEESVVKRKTFVSSLAQSAREDQQRQVEELAQVSAAAHHSTVEQMRLLYAQQQSTAKQTEEYLQQQYDNQLALNAKNEAISERLEEQQKALFKQFEMLSGAMEAVGRQGRQIETLQEVISSPRGSARWGWFAQSTQGAGGSGGDDEDMEDPGRTTPAARTARLAETVTIATGASMPTPPVYRGCTRKEKKAFMDSYLVYERRVRALNAGSISHVFQMPLSACIEHRTLVRICMYELKKREDQISEEEWKHYFLDARHVADKNYGALTQAMNALKMDTEIPDAESRVVKLVSDFHVLLDAQDMDEFPITEPKLSVEFLCAAVEPSVLRVSVNTELKKAANKRLRASVAAFLDWLKPRVESFLMFESALIKETRNAGPKVGVPSPATRHQASGQGGSKGGNKKWAGKPQSHPSPGAKTAVSGAAGPPKSARGGPTEGAERKCYKCGDPTHTVFLCPQVNEQEARAIYKQHRGDHKKAAAAVTTPGGNSAGKGGASRTTKPSIPCLVVGEVAAEVTPDTGADVTIVTRRFVESLMRRDKWVVSRNFDEPEMVEGVGNKDVRIHSEVQLRLSFETAHGRLTLHNVPCWVCDGELPTGLGDFLLSRPLMERLVYDPQKLLDDACRKSASYDMSLDPHEVRNGVQKRILAFSTQGREHAAAPEEAALREDEESTYFPEVDVNQDREAAAAAEWKALQDSIQAAIASGCSPEFARGLDKLLDRYRDVFRLVLGRDPPVDMPPLKVTRKPDSEPVRCKARRYPEEQRQFMRKHVEELVRAGLCYRNPHSKWCSPPLIVRKPDVDDFRMTVDVRRVNVQTLRILWPMPMLEVVLGHLREAEFFFALDFFKGYWQFLLDPSCQELFSFLTDMGVFTPTRVLMGGTDSVAYCQATVQEMFDEFLYKGLLIWLDDLLGYQKTEVGLLALLEKVLEVCARKGLKLNPKKCKFFAKEVVWCGRVVSAGGVKQDPRRVEALVDLPSPSTGQELQQFLCALNWMHTAIPGYNKLVQPLMDLMEKVYTKAGARTRRTVTRVLLSDVGWTQDHDSCLTKCKVALTNAVELAHPDPAQRLNVFADASEHHWGAVVTQVPLDQLDRPLAEQDHAPLMFLSGTFSGAAMRWAIIEKEAFALVETCKRADFLLHRPGGFALFTDHRNLKFIFSPQSVVSSVPKYTADKLERWAILLMAYDFEITDIAGADNVWADLLSRWGSPLTRVCAIRLVAPPKSPVLDDQFCWPTLESVAQAQATETPSIDLNLTRADDGIWRTASGAAWVPARATDLQLRLLIVAHFGAAGHRGSDVTFQVIQARFWWEGMRDDVMFFVKRCLHCASVGGGPPVPRPLGEALHAEKPNELIHFDFLYIGPSLMEFTYLLVVKDDASHFLRLYPCVSADADTTYDCLMDWFATFGIVRTWVSDQGTHFKNEVMQQLQHALGGHHHFTAARTPWSNGTVEVVMREALRCFRALLSEWRMPDTDWPRLVPVVQMVLNHTPAVSLGGNAPVTLMTGLPATSPLDSIARPGEPRTTTMEDLLQMKAANFAALQEALMLLHRAAAQASSTKRASSRQSKTKARGTAMAQYDIGDYVLYADVWSRTQTKLGVRWCGPAQVVGTVSNWIFTIKNLVTGETREAHASRLKFYWDATLDVTEDLLFHIAHNGEGHVVKRLLEARYAKEQKRYEVLVAWRGLSELENSWEPATVLKQDVPVLLNKYIAEHMADGLVTKMANALDYTKKWPSPRTAQ